MGHHPARHLVTVAVAIAFSLGCIGPMPMQHNSGNYLQSNREVRSPPEVFVPSGLGGRSVVRVRYQRLAVAELGEQSVPEDVLKALRRSPRGKPEVVPLNSAAFKRPPSQSGYTVIEQGVMFAVLQAIASTQPTTQPGATTRVTAEDFARIQAEYERLRAEQVIVQSSLEVEQLCAQARESGCDGLVLLTMNQWVDIQQSTIFSWLNLLVLPAFILPTEYFHGEVAANGWLIDPADGSVVRAVQWSDANLRLSQWIAVDGNRRKLFESQRETALTKVAEKLVE